MADEHLNEIAFLKETVNQLQSRLEQKQANFAIIDATYAGTKAEIFEDYISKLEFAFEMLQLKRDRTKIAAFQKGLKGAALAVFREEYERSNAFGDNFGQMLDYMSRKFIDPYRSANARLKLAQLKMASRSRAAYEKYFDGFCELARFIKMGDEEKLYAFMNGLESSTQRQVRFFQPKTFEQAEQFADNWINTIASVPYAADTTFASRKAESIHQRRPSEYMQLNATQTRKPFACFICDDPGHSKQHCPLKKRIAEWSRVQIKNMEAVENDAPPAENGCRQ